MSCLGSGFKNPLLARSCRRGAGGYLRRAMLGDDGATVTGIAGDLRSDPRRHDQLVGPLQFDLREAPDLGLDGQNTSTSQVRPPNGTS